MASLDQLPSGIDIYNTPVVAPPDGLTSNFERSLSSVQLATIIVFAVTFFLATASLVIRYVTTITVLKSIEPDIVLISLAWCTALGFFVSVCFEMKYGWGSDAWDIPIAELSGYYNYLLPTTLTYMWSPTLTKLSILSVLFRISTNKWFRIVTYGIGTMLIVYTIVFTALLSGPCNPRTVGSGTCLNNLAIAQVVLNISTDLLIITLPLPTLYKLQLPPERKQLRGEL